MKSLADVLVSVGLFTLPGNKEITSLHVAAVETRAHNGHGRKRERWQVAGKRLPQHMLGDLSLNNRPQLNSLLLLQRPSALRRVAR